MKKGLSNLWSKLKANKIYIVYIVGGVFLVLILLTASFYLSTVGKKEPAPSSLPPQTPSEQKAYSPTVPSLLHSSPEVLFKEYQNQTGLPKVPEAVNTYTFKTNFLLSEILNLGAQLGLNQQKISDDYVIAYNTTDEKNRGVLTFNRKTGVFFFQSFGEHKVKTSQQLPVPMLSQNFLRDLGLIDETVLCEITYQQKDIPDVTFVECHRDWGLVGLPILNFLGVLNIPEIKTLASLKLGEVDETTPTDPNIINVSMGGDGKRRPIDFNSVTVGIANNGRIISIDSNLRQITAASAVSKEDLLVPEEALNQFMNHQSQLSFTIPAGTGTFAQERVYPENKARAERAIITDYLLVFLENPPQVNQTDLVPMYVIRGTAELSSGYRVRFTETVPALKNGRSSFSYGEMSGKAAGIVTQANGQSIKLGTFTPAPTIPVSTLQPTPTAGGQPPTTVIPTIPPTIPPAEPCMPPESGLNPMYDLPRGLGRVGYWFNAYYYVPPQNQSLPDLDEVMSEFKKLNLNWVERDPGALEREWPGWSKNPLCPIRITGDSPSLFVYTKPGTYLTIKVKRSPTYADPPVLKDNEWNVLVEQDSKLRVNGFKREYLYYEYEKVFFEKPKEGWMVERGRLEEFVRDSLSPALGLTQKEEDRLVFEFNHASFDLNADHLFIGLIDQKEVEERLPLEITPQPEIILRYHFYLKPSSGKESTTPPRLLPISRSNFMILELGAIAF